MPSSIFASFLNVLKEVRFALTAPSFANMLVVACGWLLTQGQHAVTEALVMAGVAGRRHHEAFHRFFSRGTWDPDVLGTAMLYGQARTVQYKMLCGQWYRACGTRLLRIVIVATDQGAVPIRVFFTTDAALDVVRILETYAGRWAIEVFFREAKQLLGFGDSSARKEAAVRRVAPFVGLLYTALVVWFLEGASESQLATPPTRPWYPHKRGLCFADILRAARRAMIGIDLLDPGRSIDNLHKLPDDSVAPRSTTLKKAA